MEWQLPNSLHTETKTGSLGLVRSASGLKLTVMMVYILVNIVKKKPTESLYINDFYGMLTLSQ